MFKYLLILFSILKNPKYKPMIYFNLMLDFINILTFSYIYYIIDDTFDHNRNLISFNSEINNEKSIINYLYISFINNYSFAPPGEISTQFKNNKLLKIIILIQILISLLVNFISFSLYESFTNLI